MRQQTVKTRMIHARIDPKLKESAERVFSKIGISTTEAIRLFMKQVEFQKGDSQCGNDCCHVGVQRFGGIEPLPFFP